MTTFEISQQSDWLQTELESMSSQADSPAKISQSQAIKQASTASAVDYGRSAPVLLGRFSPDTPSLKTSQTCLMESGEIGLSEFSGTFPRSGMMRSGTVYQLPNLARTITEIGSGLWPTPDTTNRGARASDLVVNQSTVQRRDSGQKRGMDLQTAVKFWPTPTARDYKGCGKDGRYRNGVKQLDTVDRVVNHLDGPGQLNPTWVEWLMGFPIGHTDLNA